LRLARASFGFVGLGPYPQLRFRFGQPCGQARGPTLLRHFEPTPGALDFAQSRDALLLRGRAVAGRNGRQMLQLGPSRFGARGVLSLPLAHANGTEPRPAARSLGPAASAAMSSADREQSAALFVGRAQTVR
jgi:hypothetical protein